VNAAKRVMVAEAGGLTGSSKRRWLQQGWQRCVV